MYQYGSVERIFSDPIPIATSLWAQAGGNPSGNGAAGRPWFFKLVWKNDCSTEPWPCGFVLYPDNPRSLENLAVNAESRATAIKVAALDAFKQGFSKYPVSVVNVSEGAAGTGDNRVKVIDGYNLNSPCGTTTNLPGTTISDVYFRASMEYAQWALPIILLTAQDVQSALGRADLMKAIGAGIGNTAAHETAHQFLFGTSGMDDHSKNTYNSIDCRGDTAPWVYGIGPIRWGDVTDDALRTKFGTGWHR